MYVCREMVFVHAHEKVGAIVIHCGEDHVAVRPFDESGVYEEKTKEGAWYTIPAERLADENIWIRAEGVDDWWPEDLKAFASCVRTEGLDVSNN